MSSQISKEDATGEAHFSGPHVRTCSVMNATRLTEALVLQPPLRERIDKTKSAREYIREFHVLDLSYYPRESNLVTFRDPWSFPLLYHPQCNQLVRQHLADLSQKVSHRFRNIEFPLIVYFIFRSLQYVYRLVNILRSGTSSISH